MHFCIFSFILWHKEKQKQNLSIIVHLTSKQLIIKFNEQQKSTTKGDAFLKEL